MSRIAVASMRAWPLVFISTTTSNGVSATPTMLDSEALIRAAETLPRAIDVNAIEDCTVDGTRHKNSSPWQGRKGHRCGHGQQEGVYR